MAEDGTETITVISPHTEEPIATVTAPGPADVDTAVVAARAAFDHGPWPRLDPAERIAVVRRLAEIYAARGGEMAELISREIGAPISFARRVQVGMPSALMGAFATLAEGYVWQEDRAGFFGASVRVRREPVGVVAAITPWNVPQLLIVAKLIPALLTGCTIILKPAPESPLDALLLAEMLAQVDLPPGVVQVLPGGTEVGARLVSHPGIDKVSFTGSTAAGRAVAAAAAENLTRVSLELGGKSAAVVLDDAPLEKAVPAGVNHCMQNSGQTCSAWTRMLVPRASHDAAVTLAVAQLAKLTLGDPFETTTRLGPLVSSAQRDSVLGYIAKGKAEGARLVAGGGRPSGRSRGFFVEPTIFADVDNAMTIAQEEIFGPVLCVIPYDTEDDAVRIANDSPYGLSGGVWAGTPERATAVARRLRTGQVDINGARFNPLAPFGGYKKSGLGREIGPLALDEFFVLKSIQR